MVDDGVLAVLHQLSSSLLDPRVAPIGDLPLTLSEWT